MKLHPLNKCKLNGDLSKNEDHGLTPGGGGGLSEGGLVAEEGLEPPTRGL